MSDKITHASVFSDRAIIERTVETAFHEGDNNYIFADIPINAIKESIRIKGKGEITIAGIDIFNEYPEIYSNEEINRLTDELDLLLSKESEINKSRELNGYLKDFLNNLKIADINTGDKEYHKDIGINDYQIFYDFINNALDSLNGEDLKLNNNTADIKNKLIMMQNELNRIKKGSSVNVLGCMVSYSAFKEGKAELILSYAVYGACWSPLYDARFDYKKGTLELSYFAVTEQNTGEDWEDINMSFSTASPQTGAYLAELKTWFVDFYRPPPPAAVMGSMRSISLKKAFAVSDKKEKAEEDSFDADEAKASFEPAAEINMTGTSGSIDKNLVNQSAVISSGLNVTFDAKNRYTLKSGGPSNKAVLLIDEFPVKIQHILIPKKSENVYLKAVILNDKDYPLLKGSVKVYHDNNYIGDSVLNFIAKDEEFELFIGIAPRIEVKYTLMNKFTQKTGMTSQYKKITYKYKLTLNSYEEKEKEITCFEQIPVSNDKEIRVKAEEKDIYQEPDKQGILKAVFTIKPKEKKEILFSYSIEYPKDKYINAV